MLHWPDSMFAYLNEEQILFSQDAFGMHLATSERFRGSVRSIGVGL
jgi:flavorubredoxin